MAMDLKDFLKSYSIFRNLDKLENRAAGTPLAQQAQLENLKQAHRSSPDDHGIGL